MKCIAVLGSTGSIGTQTLDVASRFPDKLKVTVLAAAGNRAELLAEQIVLFRPKIVVVFQEEALSRVRSLVEAKTKEPGILYLTGMKGLIEAASADCVDMVVTSMVGMIGIEPTVAAIEAGKDIALANKETLVCAGAYIMKLAARKHVNIVPVDSEHGAIFQCMQGLDRRDVTKIWLTASGGPFRGFTAEQLKNVTLEQALKHPNWSMGAKITIDSATLVNKGLEMIEVKWLYDMDPCSVIPLVHPQSIIHSMVETVDGSVLAQLGPVDMRLPIEVALLYPERGTNVASPLDFRTLGGLTFEGVDESVFRSIPMAREAMIRGGLLPAVYNAANEIAVARFRRKEIGFTDIYDLIEKAMDQYIKTETAREDYDIEDVMEILSRTEKMI